MSLRGFTLMETLLSSTLIALVFILVLNLFPTSIATVNQTEHRYKALTIAASLLEQQAALPFAKLTVPTSKDMPDQEYDKIQYRTHLDILPGAGENRSWLKAIRVTVSWKYREKTRQITRELWVHRMAHQS